MSHSTSVSLDKCIDLTIFSLIRYLTLQVPHFNYCVTQQVSHFNKCLTQQVSLQQVPLQQVPLQQVSHSTSVLLQQLSHFKKYHTSASASLQKCLTQQARVALRYLIVVTDGEVCNTFMAHLCRNRVVVFFIIIFNTYFTSVVPTALLLQCNWPITGIRRVL